MSLRNDNLRSCWPVGTRNGETTVDAIERHHASRRDLAGAAHRPSLSQPR